MADRRREETDAGEHAPRPASIPSSGSGPGPVGPRRAVLIALPLAAMLIVVALVVSSGVTSSSAGAAATTKNTGSARVTRRDLISTDTQSGTLGFGDPRTVYNRLTGTITSLPVAGTMVRPGGTLFTVDNAPVVLMNGMLPAYRTLSGGVSDGPDVKELEQNLRDLGFDSGHAMTIDNTFDSATTAAVERWQASLGQTQTGIVTLGSVVFLPGQRRVSALSASLGSTGGSSGAASSPTTTSTKPLARREFVDLITAGPTTSTTTTTTTVAPAATTTTSTSSNPGPGSGPSGGSNSSLASLQALVALLKAETAELRAQLSAARSGTSGTARSGSTAPASGTASAGRSGGTGATGGGLSAGATGATASSGGASSSASGGSSGASAAGASAQAVLQTTSTELVATVPLDASKQSEAVPGQPVTVQMPDGSTVDGRISQVAAAAQTSSSGSSAGSSSAAGNGSGSSSGSSTSTVPVTITLSAHRQTAGLDQAAVSVNFQQQKAAGVLAVPVTALLATAGGGYSIQEAAAPNRLIPVTTGLFAAGYVQISGSGVDSGLQVTDSQG